MHSANFSETVKQRRGVEVQELSLSDDVFSLFVLRRVQYLWGRFFLDIFWKLQLAEQTPGH